MRENGDDGREVRGEDVDVEGDNGQDMMAACSLDSEEI